MDLNSSLTALTRHFHRERRPVRLHRLAVATATTVDGVTALIQVEYVVDLHQDLESDAPGRAEDELEVAVSDAVEDATRRSIAGWRVGDLPSTGDMADWLVGIDLPGAAVENAVVAVSDVQVTPELRRLVARAAEST